MNKSLNVIFLQQPTLGGETVVVLYSRPYKVAEMTNYHPFTTNGLMERAAPFRALKTQSREKGTLVSIHTAIRLITMQRMKLTDRILVLCNGYACVIMIIYCLLR